jgi:hypothetical protein
MASVFDGMAGALNGVFGAPVTYQPQDGNAVELRGIFRKNPIEVSDEDGHALWILRPTVRLHRSDVPNIRRGDLIQPSVEAGNTYRVVNSPETGSPAADGFVICELEVVT